MNKQRGFTLVELLVALLIGLLLAAAIIVIYAGSQSTFRASQGVSRSQEATRFAVHFLKTDIRQAGFNGCSEGVSKRSTLDQSINNDNRFPSYETAIFGWDYVGTSTPGDTFDLNYVTSPVGASDAQVQADRALNTDDADMWQGQTVTVIQDPTRGTIAENEIIDLPPIIRALEPLQGSDIVSISIADPLLSNDTPVYITTQTNERSPTLETEDREGNAIATGVGIGGIITVGDCSSVDTFQNTADAGDSFLSALENGAIFPDNNLTGAFGWQKKWNESAQVYQQTALVYFVGTGASGSPSLYRYSSNCGLVAPANAVDSCRVTVVELVEGVENLQAKYAEDITADGIPDRLSSANQVIDFDNVLSVELGILVRSVDSGLDVDNTGTYILAGDTTINPPNDRFQRFVSNTSIRLHNRGL